MLSASDAKNVLDNDKKHRIIEFYLKNKFKAGFDPTWLDNQENYVQLEAAIDYINKLDKEDNLNLAGIGSSNEATRNDYAAESLILTQLLNNLIEFTDAIPPVATGFDEKKASLLWVGMNQNVMGRSLRDLHAQSNNLGVAEKLLNSELGATEWLGEVDLERMLIKLGIKNRTHITRMNHEDIGMILHFERVKHADANEPYTIPLLINCGSGGSIRSQGSHWTYAMVTVDPTANSITIDYQDSMPLKGTEAGILRNAINYNEGLYRAFPNYANDSKTVNVASDGLQKDGWSCGYRALKGLITNPGFPIDGNVAQGADWQRLAEAENSSLALRNVVYDVLLEGVQIEPQYAERMKLDPERVSASSTGNSFNLDSKYTQHYRALLAGSPNASKSISSEHFTEEYKALVIALQPIGELAKRVVSFKSLDKKLKEVINNKEMSSDKKIMTLFEVMLAAYNPLSAESSVYGQYIKDFCAKHMGVDLGSGRYQLKKDGLIRCILDDQLGINAEKSADKPLLPPMQQKDVNQLSQSVPIINSAKKVEPKAIVSEGAITEQSALRKNKAHNRLGSMFGATQFCYALKPGGVEPGFRAIDLDEAFFNELERILAGHKKVGFHDQMWLSLLGKELHGVDDLKRKQVIFATTINSYVSGPHKEGVINPGVQWLCNEIKEAVAKNNSLSAWMYKLDYAVGEKDRVKANKEAIREFVGTRLAGIFSAQNQRQELAWVNNKGTGEHALLACGWKNGLQELTQYLHKGEAPDYKGILVEDKKAQLMRSKDVPGLAKNLIFGIAIGDRDGIGKDAQNKGFADGAFYGFDYGKPYEGDGVCASLKDDFSFVDQYANVPAFLRGPSIIGVARHFMYRNYNVFYDTDLSERMVGFHLFRKMITGENPNEEVIKSYPGLRQELHRIQENTPAPKDLLKQLGVIKSSSMDGKIHTLVDAYSMDLCTGKLSNYDLYFAKMKIDIIDMAVKNNMSYKELDGYVQFINGMQAQANKNNQQILKVFEQRMLLTRQELNLLDHLEKYCSPSTACSSDGTVLFRTLRIEPQSSRIPFQLKREEDGSYTLSTTNVSVEKILKNAFKLPVVKSGKELRCNLTQEQLGELMGMVENKYIEKRQMSQLEPIFNASILPRISAILNSKNEPQTPKIEFGIYWREDKSLSVRIVAKTEAQAQQVESVFGKKPKVNEVTILELSPKDQLRLKTDVNKLYHEEFPAKKVQKSITVSEPLSDKAPPRVFSSNKWEGLHEHAMENLVVTPTPANQLIKRFEGLISENTTLEELKKIIAEANPAEVNKLLQCSDKTLTDPENIKAILNDQLGLVKEVPEELVLPSNTTVGVTSTQRKSM